MSKQVDRQLRDLLKKGGGFEPDQMELVRDAAAQAELTWFEADCSKARNRSAVFRSVVKALDYPQFFGSSFEGLYDCLCDSILEQRVGLVMVFKSLHSSDADIQADLPELNQVLQDVTDSAADSGRVFIYSIEHTGKHPDDSPGVVRNWSED